MTANHTFSSPAPRYLDPTGVNEFGYVDPVQRLRQQQGLQALRTIAATQASAGVHTLPVPPTYYGSPIVMDPSLRVRNMKQPTLRETLEGPIGMALLLAIGIGVLVFLGVRKLVRVVRARRAAK